MWGLVVFYYSVTMCSNICRDVVRIVKQTGRCIGWQENIRKSNGTRQLMFSS